MACDNRAFLKAVVFAACLVTFVFKVWTTWEAYKVSRQLEKQSREWSWLSYIEPGGAASAYLMDVTLGGYTVVTLALLIGHILGDTKTIAESILLVLGCLLMFAIGAMLTTWVDDVPGGLVDNTIILIVLSIVTGILLLIDAGLGKKAKKYPHIRKDKNRKIVLERRIEGPIESAAKEEKREEERATRENQETQTSAPGGISSVQIRIKEPRRSWTDYKRAMEDADTMSEIERAAAASSAHTVSSEEEDGGLGHQEGRLQRPLHPHLQLATVKPSPIRHYVAPAATPFVRVRLQDRKE